MLRSRSATRISAGGIEYSTSIPVSAGSFFDRRDELGKLQEVVRQLKAGTPAWLAIVGPRKIGKTSLLLELSRRAVEPVLLLDPAAARIRKRVTLGTAARIDNLLTWIDRRASG